MYDATWANRYILSHDVVWSFTVTHFIIFFFVFVCFFALCWLVNLCMWVCVRCVTHSISCSFTKVHFIADEVLFLIKRFWYVEWIYIETLCNWWNGTKNMRDDLHSNISFNIDWHHVHLQWFVSFYRLLVLKSPVLMKSKLHRIHIIIIINVNSFQQPIWWRQHAKPFAMTVNWNNERYVKNSITPAWWHSFLMANIFIVSNRRFL